MALNLEELRQEYERLESTGKSNFLENFVKMPEGEGVITLRILPSRQSQKLYCMTRIHKVGTKNIHCPQTLVGGKWQGLCPICNYYRSLWKDSDGASKEDADKLQAEARGIKPVERYYYNVLIRSQVNANGDVEKDIGPKIWPVGKQLHAKILRAILGDPAFDEEPLGDISDPETGRDIKVVKRLKKSGADTFPNYDDSKFVNPSPLGTAKQVAMWMENLHDLQALRILKDPEELARDLRIHRGLEKDPSLEFDFGYSNKEKVVALPSVVKQIPAQKNEDADESLADSDFLEELRRM